MKNVFLFVFTCFALNILAQSGKVVYQENMKLDIKLDDEKMAGIIELLKSQMPKKVLLFTPEESLYKSLPKEVTPEDPDNEMMIKIDRSESIVYQDLKDGQITEQARFFGRNFLINEKTTSLKWKLESETEDIAGYTCQKATTKVNDNVITAWFTAKIPVATGPDKFGQLPGLILKLSFDDRLTILATEVSLSNKLEDTIAPPKKGKKVNREQYEKIVARKNKEMKEEYGGDGNVIIQTIEVDED